MNNSIQKRQTKEKQILIEQFKKTPIVQIACEKSGLSRATYYRWRKDDSKFAKDADSALEEGSHLINDLAESQLISAVKDKNMTGIIFWLKHHHPAYATKVEVTTSQKTQEALSPEQEEIVKNALTLTGIVQKDSEQKND